MYNKKTFLAIIPARGGSKGIPHKNIININGRPLIDYTISAASKSKYLDRIVVSTDCEKISAIAKECGADVPFLRSKELAKDDSRTIDCVINLIENIDQKYDYIVLLQPTQPLRKSIHIDEAIELVMNEEYDESLVSVSKVAENPVLLRTINEFNQIKKMLNINSTIRRQDFPEFYKVNGSIYINRIDEKLNSETSFNDNTIPYIMDEQFDLDIDEPFDLEILKLKLKLLRLGN
ncbi:cytidylyltransferase domain-containing protein [Pseudalkalibacillus hwajinpoensis]|uniref:Acylneuraminate cytidylyltransferase family protein n=1 Tax=Guptibacillus hwajinpoensis TaxID=208199 RepID=A0A4U1MK03_9BACL|nr:acylneuraminate cytidylyltransferase family protein [Pseudalkalibacillus hwajinpoensis]TKD70740.1 acylneuraminate cytidylyltransferase family protein [Pseudalkalibacillus hwajinpoensis]